MSGWALIGKQIFDAASQYGLLDPAKRALMYEVNELAPNILLPVDAYIAQAYRGLISKEQAEENARKQGINKATFDNIYKQFSPLIGLGDLIRLYYRKQINIDQLTEESYKLGYDDYTLRMYMTLFEYFPTPDDLIRFAVREVYTPKTVEAFGMMEDFPEDFARQAAKAGVSEEQAKNHWAAHWQLPSPNMAFEMYQRNIITYNEMLMLLKSLDIMPFWRDKLIQLSFKTLTRVDVRRMWDLGVITEKAELVRKYRDVGYSPDDADNLADFTIVSYSNEMEGITRANIGSAYESGIIGEDNMRAMLGALNKSETFVIFWSDYYIYKRAEKEVKALEDKIIDMYKSGGASYDEVRQMILDNGASNDYVNYFMRKIRAMGDNKIKYPDLSTVLRWYEKGIINQTKFIEYMRKLNYSDEISTNYLIEINEIESSPNRKYLSESQYFKFFKLGLMSQDEVLSVYKEKGLSVQDANNLFLTQMQGVSNETT
jgi:hypothetical protein